MRSPIATPQTSSASSITQDFTLSKLAYGHLRSFFQSANHSPSPDQMRGLIDIMKTIEDMAKAEAVARALNKKPS